MNKILLLYYTGRFDYLDRNKDAIVEYLRNFISIPSINYDRGEMRKKFRIGFLIDLRLWLLQG